MFIDARWVTVDATQKIKVTLSEHRWITVDAETAWQLAATLKHMVINRPPAMPDNGERDD